MKKQIASEFCVFHIPSSEYIYCHMSSSRMFMLPSIGDKKETGLIPVAEDIHVYLLPPGSTINYDSPTKFFRSPDPKYLLTEIKKY